MTMYWFVQVKGERRHDDRRLAGGVGRSGGLIGANRHDRAAVDAADAVSAVEDLSPFLRVQALEDIADAGIRASRRS